MDKYINATRLSNTIDKALRNLDEEDNTVSKMYCRMAMEYAKRLLEEEIAAGGEYGPVVHAHWIGVDGSYTCSKCGSACIEKDNEWINIKFGCAPVLFCPRCGAVMDEPTENFGHFQIPEVDE